MKSALLCFALAEKFFISSAFGILFIHGAELFPTIVRGLALANQSLTGKISCFIELEHVVPGLPLFAFGVMCIYFRLLVSVEISGDTGAATGGHDGGAKRAH